MRPGAVRSVPIAGGHKRGFGRGQARDRAPGRHDALRTATRAPAAAFSLRL
ncbi:hypothetical protein BURPS668_0463 [Burkholderia pseudomallei 668]|nr:hypothetical protein BURPS668_0463 [Burkholderia pseudomallei 668]